MRVVGLDPGGTTGWVIYDPLKSTDLKDCFMIGQMGPQDHHDDLDAFLGSAHIRDMIIVCEQFEWRPNRHQNAAYGDRYVELISREYIGVVKRFVQETARRTYDPVVLCMQSAAQAKGFVKDENIKKLGLWEPGFRHAMDAMRHVLFYVVHHGPKDLSTPLLQQGWK